MYATSHVFQHEDNSHVTPPSNTNTNNNGGRREIRIFLDGNTVIILSLCQLKMRMLRFIVHSGDKVPSSFKNTTPNFKKRLEPRHS